MTRLEWDIPEDRKIISGVDRGVVYFPNAAPKAWNGLVSVTEDQTDADVYDAYFDGEKYSTNRAPEGVSVQVEAYTYPDGLDEYDGEVDLCWRNKIANVYEIHLLYNVLLDLKDEPRQTINDSSDPLLFQWEGPSRPVVGRNLRATSHVLIRTEDVTANLLSTLENILYGTDSDQPRMPQLTELLDIFEDAAVFIVIDNGDGTWRAIGPDDWIEMVSATEFKITSPSARYITQDLYSIRTW